MARCPLWLAFMILALSAFAAGAEAPRQLDWKDLVPKGAPIRNPLSALTPDQRYEIAAIERARRFQSEDRLDAGGTAGDEARQAERRLLKQGVDVYGLLAEYQVFRRKTRKRRDGLVDALDGQLVRMPGYLLPLEFADTGVTEFLLVPYVGACIHVPPPPPNQIVFVRAKAAFRSKGLFTPVWVTGRMSIKRTRQSLSLVDGTSNVDVGYALDGGKVEPYAE